MNLEESIQDLKNQINILKYQQFQYFDTKLRELFKYSDFDKLKFTCSDLTCSTFTCSDLEYPSISNNICILPLDSIKQLITESLIQLNHTINITKGYYFIHIIEHARLYYAGTIWIILYYGYTDELHNEMEDSYDHWMFLFIHLRKIPSKYCTNGDYNTFILICNKLQINIDNIKK